MKTLVMKFGGASVATSSHFAMIAKKIIEAKQINGKIEKLEKQTAMNTNKIIELEKRITDIIMKMRDFEEWVKEALSKIEYKQ